MSDKQTTDHGVLVCRRCDIFKPENQWRVGSPVDGSKCPDCGEPLFEMNLTALTKPWEFYCE